MKRLILDYLKRNKWIILFIGLYVVMTLASIFFDSEESREHRSEIFSTMFLFAMFFGTMILSGSRRTLGFDRAVRVLPLSSRQVGVGIWVCDVLSAPLAATATITLLFCIGFALGTVSGDYFQSLPLILVWGLMLGAVFLDLNVRGRPQGLAWLLLILDIGFLALAYKYAPPILDGWAAFETHDVLILSLGGVLAGASFYRAFRSYGALERRRASPARKLGKDAPAPALPSRRIGVLMPWLRTVAYSLIGLVLMLVLGAGYLMIAGRAWPTMAYFSEQPFAPKYAFLSALFSWNFGLFNFASWMPAFRALRSLPRSTNRLAFMQMGFTTTASIPVFLVALGPVIVYQREGILAMASIFLVVVGVGSSLCALAMSLGAHSNSLRSGAMGGSLAVLGFFLARSPRDAIDFNAPAISATLLVSALVLLGASFLLLRQAISASSRPYRTTGLLRGGFPERT